MATHAPTRGAPSTNGNDARERVGDLAVTSRRGGRRTRVPELAAGLLVMLTFAFAAVLWQLNATRKEPALALSRDVARGAVVTPDDLRIVYLGTDDPITRVRPHDSEQVIGRRARADLSQGMLVAPGMVDEAPVVRPGEGIVGLSLEPGQVPTSRLRPGDVVNVIAGPNNAGTSPDGVIGKAEVFAVEQQDGEVRLFVSLRTTEASAGRIAAVAERGPVRLVLVGA